MLKNLYIKNIKSFNKEANLKIAPLTLIYGPNSSGKSTLWKFLIALSRSQARPSGKNFINFSRNLDFANTKTISFDPTEISTFGFKFDYLKYGKDDDQIVSDKNNEFKFQFSFTNSTLDLDFESDLDLITDMAERIKDKDSYTNDEKEQLLKEVLKLKKIREKMKINTKKNYVVEDGSVYLNDLEILKNNSLFAKFKIHKLKNPLLRDRDKERSLARYQPAFLRSNPIRHEDEIADILISHYKDKIKHQVGYELSKDFWNEEIDGPFKKTLKKFDFLGPYGPFSIKVNSESYEKINYLFLPTEISKNPEVWKEHFEFLQYLKKLIKNNVNNKDKNEKELYASYIEENYKSDTNYFEMLGIDADKSIPEIKKNFEQTIKAMSANSISEFIEIISKDLKNYVMCGASFIPTRRLFSGGVYFDIFDTLCTKFVDSYVALDHDNPQADEFFSNYARFNKFSFDDQIRNLFKFGNKELKSFRESSTSMMSRFSMSPRYYASVMDEENKKETEELLKKIELPFTIKTQEDEKGNPLVGFSNKKILGTQKNIPLEQSGNALQAIISILNDLNRSDEDIIVIEEPENKVHPKIQGNLIEIIAERVEKGPSQAIIETHSEHFILRIQKLIREKKLHPSDVAINYVYLDENGEGSKIDHMNLDKDGKFINKWRHGFFTERLNEY